MYVNKRAIIKTKLNTYSRVALVASKHLTFVSRMCDFSPAMLFLGRLLFVWNRDKIRNFGCCSFLTDKDRIGCLPAGVLSSSSRKSANCSPDSFGSSQPSIWKLPSSRPRSSWRTSSPLPWSSPSASVFFSSPTAFFFSSLTAFFSSHRWLLFSCHSRLRFPCYRELLFSSDRRLLFYFSSPTAFYLLITDCTFLLADCIFLLSAYLEQRMPVLFLSFF